MEKRMDFFDKCIIAFDQGLRTLATSQLPPNRPNPASGDDKLQDLDKHLSKQAKQTAARMMRVNHAGEVAAQGLYAAQGFMARDKAIQKAMEKASAEENDHLAWCEERLNELGGKVSVFNPIWFGGAFLFGTMAGMAGDKTNLGFVAETEKQVVRHLEKHLKACPKKDKKTRVILEKMREDEAKHATHAISKGAVSLPFGIPTLMGCASKVMTTVARYW